MKKILKSTAMTMSILIIAIITTIETSYAQASTEKAYVKIEVDGLSCPFCAYGLEKKLVTVNTAQDIVIDIKEGEATFSVSNDQKPTEKELKKIVKDADFTPKQIIFSETAFATKAEE
ncbi:mercuric ion binding protein [Flavobacteriaceae bacterium MAR_2010_188]|nr:mercuric ion binding protein [Flavobacteriaceae bacterium MAR_2010_188]